MKARHPHRLRCSSTLKAIAPRLIAYSARLHLAPPGSPWQLTNTHRDCNNSRIMIAHTTIPYTTQETRGTRVTAPIPHRHWNPACRRRHCACSHAQRDCEPRAAARPDPRPCHAGVSCSRKELPEYQRTRSALAARSFDDQPAGRSLCLPPQSDHGSIRQAIIARIPTGRSQG